MGCCIELNVLGRLEIRTEGEPVELRAKKARALLAYLAVENGRPITREQLATLLWGGTRDERALITSAKRCPRFGKHAVR